MEKQARKENKPKIVSLPIMMLPGKREEKKEKILKASTVVNASLDQTINNGRKYRNEKRAFYPSAEYSQP